MNHGEFDMSLLGPDDFGLDKKGRKKKLAKDLSPTAQEDIEKWIDRDDDSETFEHLIFQVGPEEARRLMAQREAKVKRKVVRDPLMEEE